MRRGQQAVRDNLRRRFEFLNRVIPVADGERRSAIGTEESDDERERWRCGAGTNAAAAMLR